VVGFKAEEEEGFIQVPMGGGMGIYIVRFVGGGGEKGRQIIEQRNPCWKEKKFVE